MSKQYGCPECNIILDESELVTVTNKKWIMNPTDIECCPDCEELAIEIED